MRCYRLLLRLTPAALRSELGAAIEETVERRLADARAAGARRLAIVWCRELAGVVVLAVSERWGTDARKRRRRNQESRRKAGAMDTFSQEIRHAARRLTRSPAFSVAAVLTLALAIGANTSIFAVVQHVVLNPLPYPDSDRLVEIDHGAQRLNVLAGFGTTRGLAAHYAERARTLNGVATYSTEEGTLTGDGEPERIRMARAARTLAPVLRVSPALGRWFTETEGVPGAAQVAVLSHGLWTRRYHADRGIVGRPVMFGGVQTEVIGVMPAGFAFPNAQVDMWIAAQIPPQKAFGLWSYGAVARLRDGATVAGAQAELTGLIADLPTAFPNDTQALANIETNLVVNVRTLKETIVGGVAGALWMLLASVGLVLLVACANVANLFLVRSEARQRDVAVRRALGASHLGIARYFLAESALLSIAGGAVGLALAWAAVRLLLAFGPTTLPRLTEVRLDAVSVVFTFALSLLSASGFGVIPLWRLRGPTQFAAALHEIGRSNTASRGRHHVRHLLMGAQVALALVLLISSGLMIRSFQNLRAVDPGFEATSTLTFSIGLPDRDYPTMTAAVSAHHAMLDRLSGLPGVKAAAATTCLPLSGGCNGNTLRVEGRVYPEGVIPPLSLFRAVSGGYLEAMGMRLVRGRGIDRSAVDHNEPVAVVNEALVRAFFPDQDPIGQRVASNRWGALTWLTIVGVVANTPIRALNETRTMAQVFMPMSVAGGPGIPRAALVGPDISAMNYVVRTSTPPLDLLPSVRRAIDTIDRSLAIAQVRTLQQMLDTASAQMAFTMVLLAIAAGVTLALGVIGIYGVMSYIVSQRTAEIGVRLALGAEPGSVAGMIARQGGVVAVAGIAAGLASALAGGRLIESLLFGVSPRDPIVFAATTAVLLSVALLACWLPARRAAALNPIEALRAD